MTREKYLTSREACEIIQAWLGLTGNQLPVTKLLKNFFLKCSNSHDSLSFLQDVSYDFISYFEACKSCCREP
jgi:hypothetical protein